MTTIDQLALVVQQTMQQVNQFATAMQQVIQVHQPQMTAVATGTPIGQADSRVARVLDMRYLKYTVFEGVSLRYDDWAFSFKRAVRSVNCDAYDLLVHVER